MSLAYSDIIALKAPPGALAPGSLIYVWHNGAGDQNWNNTANWLSGVVPSADNGTESIFFIGGFDNAGAFMPNSNVPGSYAALGWDFTQAFDQISAFTGIIMPVSGGYIHWGNAASAINQNLTIGNQSFSQNFSGVEFIAGDNASLSQLEYCNLVLGQLLAGKNFTTSPSMSGTVTFDVMVCGPFASIYANAGTNCTFNGTVDLGDNSSFSTSFSGDQNQCNATVTLGNNSTASNCAFNAAMYHGIQYSDGGGNTYNGGGPWELPKNQGTALDSSGSPTITQDNLDVAMVGFLAGQVSTNDNGNGTATSTYLKQDGATTALENTYVEGAGFWAGAGARTSNGTMGA